MKTHNLTTTNPLGWVALVLMCVLPAGSASAQQGSTFWTNPTLGNWFDSGNWDYGVPEYMQLTRISNGGTAFINSPGAVSAQLHIGSTSTTGGGLLISNGGKLLVYGRVFIDAPTPTFVPASVTVTGDGSHWGMQIGLLVNTGTLLVENGGSVGSGIQAFIGHDPGSRGSVTVTGPGSTWRIDSDTTSM